MSSRLRWPGSRSSARPRPGRTPRSMPRLRPTPGTAGAVGHARCRGKDRAARWAGHADDPHLDPETGTVPEPACGAFRGAGRKGARLEQPMSGPCLSSAVVRPLPPSSGTKRPIKPDRLWTQRHQTIRSNGRPHGRITGRQETLSSRRGGRNKRPKTRRSTSAVLSDCARQGPGARGGGQSNGSSSPARARNASTQRPSARIDAFEPESV
ncbi:hypothetical protein EV662_10513 [Rhodovulum marinum]|uniref:Uncharacterized protein n=1 Tax=Rhodovulum marinum TaxID=320662 RepID=A0A4R2PYZ4_9RHOB|nr:hypothetical protein EV662_10513 [Rhodovulum marinum]